MIRHAGREDAAGLADLSQSIWSWHAQHYPEAFYPNPDPAGVTTHFAARLADPDVTCFLTGDPPFGYALCALQTRAASLFSPPVRRLMIEHIAVSPDARRQGAGRALLAAARGLARDLTCDEILLDTWAGNDQAHAFFVAEGFAPRRMLFRATP